jgi:hypothetical protein
MLTIWRVNGYQFRNLPKIHRIVLEGDDDTGVITKEEYDEYVLLLAYEACTTPRL